MKKFYLLIAALLVVVMSSMMLTEKNDSQQTKSSTMEKTQPMFLKGMITMYDGIPRVCLQESISSGCKPAKSL